MEYLYALYLLSGIIKTFLMFFNVSSSIDFTLLTGSLLLTGLLFHVLIKRVYKFDAKSVVSMFLLLFFFLWINITILYSPSSNYSYEKSFLFLTNVLAFVTPLFYKKFDLIKFLRFFTILSPALGLLFLVFYFPIIYPTTDSEYAFSGLYLSIPEFCGLCLLIFVIFKELFPPVFNWLLLILNALVVVLCGGKGPIVFTSAVLILYVSARFFSRYVLPQARNHHPDFKSIGVKKILLLTFFVGASLFLLGAFFVNTKILLDRSLARLMLLYSGQPGMEHISGRIGIFVFAANHIFDNVRSLLFGYGLGSYSILFGASEGRAYPHNIILEIWIETGLIGVLLFSFFLTHTCERHLRANPFAWFVLFLFLNAMKSSSLVDLRLFFGFLALLGLYSKKIAASRVEILGAGIIKKELH